MCSPSAQISIVNYACVIMGVVLSSCSSNINGGSYIGQVEKYLIEPPHGSAHSHTPHPQESNTLSGHMLDQSG